MFWREPFSLRRLWAKRLEPKRDPARDLAQVARRYFSWAIQHSPPALGYQFWLKRDLTIFDITIDDFVAGCGKPPAAADAATAEGADGSAVVESSFVGLVPYTDQDARFFFGREREQRLIIANLSPRG